MHRGAVFCMGKREVIVNEELGMRNCVTAPGTHSGVTRHIPHFSFMIHDLCRVLSVFPPLGYGHKKRNAPKIERSV